MNRSLTNFIRFFMDECLPPIIRDNRFFMYPFFWLAYRGKNINATMNFKKNAYSMTEKEYAEFYSNLDSISKNRNTDLNQKCLLLILEAIQQDTDTQSLLDVGYGNAYLLNLIKSKFPHIELHGIDINQPANSPAIKLISGNIAKLPYKNKSIDIVICTHVLEHCIHPSLVIDEMKRVARKLIIVVVPKQRYYFYTLDEHLNFYHYPEKLISDMGLERFKALEVQGDLFYKGLITN